MKLDNYEKVSRLADGWDEELCDPSRTSEDVSEIQAQAVLDILKQLAGIHDALIRLEATLRMIGVQMQERSKP